MPYTLLHDGLTREFDFFAPPAWPYWVAQAWIQRGRVGLPLVIAMHGATQDPLAFQEEWFFPQLWGLDLDGNELLTLADRLSFGLNGTMPDYQRLLENRLFVLYPYGFGWTDRTLSELAYQLVSPTPIPRFPNLGIDLRPLYREQRTSRGWSTGVDGVTTGPAIDDVGFIKEMLRVVGKKLRKELEPFMDQIDVLTEDTFPWKQVQIGTLPPIFDDRVPNLFDVDRRFLFGYSNGGMLAHKLVREMPNEWAAVWGMATTVGGKAYRGLGLADNTDAVVNLPDVATGTHTTSFFAHHGEKDNIAPPGLIGNPLGTGEYELQSPYGVASWQYALGGFSTALDFMPAFLPLAQGWRGYIAYNGLSEGSVRRLRPGIGDFVLSPELPEGPGPTGPLVPGPPDPSTQVRTAYEYASDDASTDIEGVYPYTANPICVMYVDPNMTHTNFTTHPDRYFFAKDVWAFFRTHPRVLL